MSIKGNKRAEGPGWLRAVIFQQVQWKCKRICMGFKKGTDYLFWAKANSVPAGPWCNHTDNTSMKLWQTHLLSINLPVRATEIISICLFPDCWCNYFHLNHWKQVHGLSACWSCCPSRHLALKEVVSRGCVWSQPCLGVLLKRKVPSPTDWISGCSRAAEHKDKLITYNHNCQEESSLRGLQISREEMKQGWAKVCKLSLRKKAVYTVSVSWNLPHAPHLPDPQTGKSKCHLARQAANLHNTLRGNNYTELRIYWQGVNPSLPFITVSFV